MIGVGAGLGREPFATDVERKNVRRALSSRWRCSKAKINRESDLREWSI